MSNRTRSNGLPEGMGLSVRFHQLEQRKKPTIRNACVYSSTSGSDESDKFTSTNRNANRCSRARVSPGNGLVLDPRHTHTSRSISLNSKNAVSVPERLLPAKLLVHFSTAYSRSHGKLSLRDKGMGVRIHLSTQTGRPRR